MSAKEPEVITLSSDSEDEPYMKKAKTESMCAYKNECFDVEDEEPVPIAPQNFLEIMIDVNPEENLEVTNGEPVKTNKVVSDVLEVPNNKPTSSNQDANNTSVVLSKNATTKIRNCDQEEFATKLRILKTNIHNMLDLLTQDIKANDKRLDSKIQNAVKELEETSSIKTISKLIVISYNFQRDMASKPSEKWKLFRCFYYKLCNPHDTRTSAVESEPENSEYKKESLIKKFDAKIEKILKEIRKWDEKDTDLDDEANSAYLVRTRLIQSCMKHWMKRCEIAGESTSTGRPTQKRFNFENLTSHEVVNKEITSLMNSKEQDYCPDYFEILELTKKCLLSVVNIEEVDKIAQNAFKAIVKNVKLRRMKDFIRTLPVSHDTEDELKDPADTDSELAKKLEENKNMAKSEQKVLEEYTNKSQESGETINEEQADSSECESECSVEEVCEVESISPLDLSAQVDDTDSDSESWPIICSVMSVSENGIQIPSETNKQS